MAFRVVVGNKLAAPAVVTMTPSADADFPEAHLFDGPGQLGALFGALGTDPRVQVDLNGEIAEELVDHGDGGAGPDATTIAATGFTPGVETDWSGTLSPPPGVNEGAELSMSDEEDEGSNGFSLKSITSYGALTTWRFPLTLRRGALYRIDGWVKTGSAPGARIRLKNTLTGGYLLPDGSWSPTEDDFAADDAGVAFQGQDDVDFTVQGVGPATSPFELQLVVDTSAGTAYFDSLSIRVSPASVIPSTNILAVMNGHNIPAGTTVQWISADTSDFASPTTRATGTAAVHQFVLEASAPFTARFHRLVIVGTPGELVYMSDVVLGLIVDLEPEPADGISIEYPETGQIRQQSPAGSRRVQNRGPYPPRRLNVKFRFRTAAEEAAFRAVIVDELRGGAESVLVMPAADLVGVALYGEIETPLQFTHSMLSALQPDPERREYYSDVNVSIVEGSGFEIAQEG